MRVTFVVSNYAPSVGGAQLLVQRIAEGLVRSHGCEVDVITTDALLSPGGPRPGRIAARDEVLEGVIVRRRPVARRAHSAVRTLRRAQIRLGGRRLLPASELAANGPMGVGLARAVQRAAGRADVVVGVSSSFLTVPFVAVAGRARGAATVQLPLLHVDGTPLRPTALRALRRADRCIALTTFEAERLVADGVLSERTMVIPPGCEPEQWERRAPGDARRQLGLPDRPTVAYIGRMARHKGIDVLLRAMADVWRERPDVSLLLAGNRTGWSDFEGLVDDARRVAGDRLIVRDGFADADKAKLYAAADVVAFPSREESFGIVTLESWCARRPVVCGDIGAVRSLVRDGEDAVLVDVDDAGGWAGELVSLLDDAPRRTSMGEAGRRRAETEFPWGQVVDRWYEMLAEAADERSAGVTGTG